MEPDVDPVAEAAKLPLSERTSHKNWKVREAAYRELTDKFNVAPEDSKIYTDFVAALPKIARDANAPAQLIGFEAIAKFADTAPPPLVKRVATDVVKGIVDKGLAGRPLNKSKAIDAFLMFVGADAGDVAVETMAANGFKHRTPKVVAASVDSILQALSTYGSSAVPILAITTKLPPLFGHSQETVRNAAKALVIELHRWIGDKVKVVVKNAKEVTVKEVEAAFEVNAKNPKPKPKKLTRAMEQRVRASAQEGGGSDEDDGFGDGIAEEEEIDLAEEIDLLEKLSKVKIEIEEGVTKDWYFALDSKKWSARKQALDAAISIIGDARLVPGTHQEIFVRLRKILTKDSNVNVVASAAKLIRAMCYGLKKAFPSGAAKGLSVDLFGRLKEKNRILVDAVSAALDALHEKKCLLIVEFLDEITTAASHKVPKARSELLKWVGRCIRTGMAPVDLKGNPLKCFGNMFVKATDDSSPEVRDAALAGLASLQKLLGDRNVAAFMEKLDKKRKDKVAAIVADLPEPKKVSSAKAPTAQSSVTTRSKAAKQAAEAKAAKAAAAKKLSSAPKRAKPLPPKKPVIEESDDEGEISLKSDDILSIAEERFEGFQPDQWSGKSFKGRVAAVSTVTSVLEPKETFTDEDIAICLALLACEPGLNDSNFMALKPKLELFGMVATKCTSHLPRKTLKPLLLIAVEKIGDIKCAKIASAIMMSFAEATSARYLFEILSQAIQETKNSRAVVGMLKFGSSLVEDFSVPAVPGKTSAKLTSISIGFAAPAARTAALALGCKTALRYGAEKFRKLLEEAETPQESLELFDTEMQKYTRDPDPPTRKKRFGVSQNPSPAVEEVPEEPEPPMETVKAERMPPKVGTPTHKPSKIIPEQHHDGPQEHIPEETHEHPPEEPEEEPQPQVKPTVRVSIASEFAPNSRIFLDLKNSNWKKRQDALTAITLILENAGDFVKPNVGSEIISALRARLSDSNRNLAAMTFSVVGRFVQAMGPGAIIHVKALVPAVLGQGCVDIKKSVRESAMKCLDSWFDTVGLAPLIPYCHLPFDNLNSGFRKDFLEWLIPRLRGDIGNFESNREDLAVLVDPCLVCLRDRTVEVRQLAEVALEQVVASVGIGVVDSKVATLNKSSRLQLGPILDKLRDQDPKARPSEAPDATSTPRSVRERPRSVAVPRTPASRKALAFGDDESVSSGRRPRPASARMSPAVSPFVAHPSPKPNEPLLKENNGHDGRSRRYMNKRKRFVEELSESNPSSGVTPLIGEELQDLVADLRECVSSALEVKLTAPSNRFRMHVEAIQMTTAFLADNPDTLLPVSDVLLRWSACRIEDSRTPPTVLVKLAEFVSTMCEILMSSGVKLGEYEASAILPPIIEKCGSNRSAVRQAMLGGLLSIGDVVEDEVLLVLLTSCLRHPVNSRAHDEVSSEICRLIDKRCESGAGIPPGVLPTIGRVAGGHDDGAGRAAAVCLERAHEHFGDDLWNLVGDLTDDEAGLLDERLTRVISAMKPENSSPSRGEVDSLMTPHEVGITDLEGTPTSNAQPAFPNDIRNEDFRLSVAPAPPSSVLTSISDSLSAGTPQKTRRELGSNAVEPTPRLPSKRQPRLESSRQESQVVADVLSRLQNAERDVQLSGLASIFDDLKKEGSLLQLPHGAVLLPALVHCFAQTLQRLQGNDTQTDDPAVLKSFLKGVIRFAREPSLLRQLDQPSIEALLNDALGAMIPQTVSGVEDWDQVRRGVNLMIVKILESCNQNLLFTALINLLLTNIRVLQQPTVDKTSALAKCSICLKSITKVAKRGFQYCRIDALLRDIHMFLVVNPVRRDGLASAEEQTFAMRLLKSTINHIVEEIGGDIRTKLDLIPQPEKSQVVHYINMTMKDMGEKEIEFNKRGSVDDGSDVGSDDSSFLRREIFEALALVDMQGNSDVGIQKLKGIVGSNANIDVSPYLQDYPESFRTYVNKALMNVETPIEGGSVSQGIESSQSVPIASSDGSMHEESIDTSNRADRVSASHSTGQVYLERLHDIQMRYGLQSVTRPGGDGVSNSGVGEKENGAVERLPSVEETRGKASYLRERMARIRELQSAAKE